MRIFYYLKINPIRKFIVEIFYKLLKFKCSFKYNWLFNLKNKKPEVPKNYNFFKNNHLNKMRE